MAQSIKVDNTPVKFSAENISGKVEHASIDAPAPSGLTAFSPTVILGFAFIVLFVLARAFGVGKKQKLPAGVKPLPRLPGLPYAGRFWDVPAPGIEAAWHFGDLHKKMGPIYEWKVMGTIHIWIETDKIAHDLFVTRQRNYCDRNALPAAVGVREGSEILPLMAFGEQFKRYKNFMHLIMRHSSPRSFYGWPTDENKRTLRRILETPEHWSEHMLVHCARTIAGVAWADPEHGSKLLTIIPVILKAVSPAGPIINKLTFLANLPEAISPFKKIERVRKQQMTDAFCEALQDVKNRVEAGDAPDCWSKLWLEKEKGTEHLDFYEAAHAIGSSSSSRLPRSVARSTLSSLQCATTRHGNSRFRKSSTASAATSFRLSPISHAFRTSAQLSRRLFDGVKPLLSVCLTSRWRTMFTRAT